MDSRHLSSNLSFSAAFVFIPSTSSSNSPESESIFSTIAFSISFSVISIMKFLSPQVLLGLCLSGVLAEVHSHAEGRNVDAAGGRWPHDHPNGTHHTPPPPPGQLVESNWSYHPHHHPNGTHPPLPVGEGEFEKRHWPHPPRPNGTHHHRPPPPSPESDGIAKRHYPHPPNGTSLHHHYTPPPSSPTWPVDMPSNTLTTVLRP
ncbi:hypothetical protein F5Y18DRAFT_258056 [Xylariaceae sp. FL1019]|nr:hypothetical protein F5Y18DRAFT_258056 [Xylariaceae sp. FL1019]